MVLPESCKDFGKHRFIGADDPKSRAPFARWMQENVPAENIIFRSGDVHAQRRAILSGVGIGFTSVLQAAEVEGLVQVVPPKPEWAAPLWLVTHMDLHRTTKVQAFLAFLKDHSKAWQPE